jgi:hypothetical protein
MQANAIQPCRRNDEQGKREPIATCGNVHQAMRVTLHGLGPDTKKGIVCSPEVKIPLENVSLDWKIILKWFSQKLDVSVCTGFMWLRIGTDGGLL